MAEITCLPLSRTHLFSCALYFCITAHSAKLRRRSMPGSCPDLTILKEVHAYTVCAIFYDEGTGIPWLRNDSQTPHISSSRKAPLPLQL